MCDVSDPVKSEAQKTPAEPPTKRPTQADVARLAGVSTATVSHVLSGRADRRGPGSSETRAAVEAAARTAGLQLSGTRFYSQVVQDCLSYGMVDCEEIHALTPTDSACALPVPDDATLTERYLTLDRAIG